jgi:predicted LPLAT superfamily acyltransferase
MLDKLLAMAGRYPTARVRQRGADAVYQRALAGQGGVLVTAHTGCLELCQVLAEERPGFRLNVLVHTRHAEAFNRILKRLHPEAGVELIEVTELDMALMARLADKVAAGEYIAIAGDRVPVRGDKTVHVDFLGAPAPFPVGPYLIAALIGCPLHLMLCLHEGDGYAIDFELLAERVVLPRRAREQALAAQAQAFADALAARLRRSPYDWFNFYAFWDADALHHV